MMELLELMGKVNDREEYYSNPLEEAQVVNLLQAVQYAPSLENVQPWEIYIIQSEEMKAKIVEATLSKFFQMGSTQDWLMNTPLLLIFCYDQKRVNVRFGDSGDWVAIQDISGAVQNARLMAAEIGLSTSICRAFDRDALRKALNMPEQFKPVTILAVGYVEDSAEQPPRLPIEDFVHWEE